MNFLQFLLKAIVNKSAHIAHLPLTAEFETLLGWDDMFKSLGCGTRSLGLIPALPLSTWDPAAFANLSRSGFYSAICRLR